MERSLLTTPRSMRVRILSSNFLRTILRRCKYCLYFSLMPFVWSEDMVM